MLGLKMTPKDKSISRRSFLKNIAKAISVISISQLTFFTKPKPSVPNIQPIVPAYFSIERPMGERGFVSTDIYYKTIWSNDAWAQRVGLDEIGSVDSFRFIK